METKQQDKRKSWLKGLGIAALAVIFFVVVASFAATPTEKKATAKATCVILARSVPYFAEAVSEGRAPTVNKIGGVLTGPVCVRLATELQRNPNEPSDTLIQAETPSGELTAPKPVTFQDLVAPAPAPEEVSAPVDFELIVDCIQAYPSQTDALLRELCYDGLLSPGRR
jgi:hypothetical protein